MGKRIASPRLAGNFVQGALGKLGVAPEWRAFTEWNEICGPVIAAKTLPERLVRGVLTVRVASSAWVNDLAFVKAQLLERLNRTTQLQVRDLRFMVGPVEPTSVPALPPPVTHAPLPPEQLDATVADVSDPELRAALRSLGLRVVCE